MSSSSTENLHVPQSKSGSALNSQSVKSIMDAYKTQSKIQLYDDNSAQSQGAGNESIGVTGRNIPLSMLRPSEAAKASVSKRRTWQVIPWEAAQLRTKASSASLSSPRRVKLQWATAKGPPSRRTFSARYIESRPPLTATSTITSWEGWCRWYK